MSGATSTADIHEQIQRRLAEHEIRYTHGRKSVVTSILLLSGPRSAAELVEESTLSLPVSSLYRTLAVFEETGILRKHHGSDGVARYELAEWLTGHHHHVICVACGAIEDIDISDPVDDDIHRIAEQLGERAGYRVLDHVLEVEGVCARCEPAHTD